MATAAQAAVPCILPRHSMSTQAGATVGKVKKFYKDVAVDGDDEGFFVTLDGRRLKTPARTKLSIPTETIAYMAAQEWDSQDEHINLSSMYITNLCNAATDNVSYTHTNRVDALLEYLHTDTIVFREENPEAWEDLQAEVWDPLVAWANGKYALDLQTTTAIFAPEVSEGDLATMRNVVDGFGDESVPAGTPDHKTWGLMGLEHLTATSKSMIVSLALLDGEVTVEEAARAARLEVVFQTSRFGEVEWHHTLEQYDTTVRLGAAALFTRECMNAKK